MEHEIEIQMLPPATPNAHALLLFSFGTSNFIFQVDKPELLAQWLAYLFKYREERNPEAEPEQLVVGHYGPNKVWFTIEEDDMLLSSLDEGFSKQLVPSMSMFFPRDLLDDMADGLAREHRFWVEHPPPQEGPAE